MAGKYSGEGIEPEHLEDFVPTDELQSMFVAADTYAAIPPTTSDVVSNAVGVASAVIASERDAVAVARKRRRRGRLVALALAGAVAVPSGAWAANRLLAQTGLFGDGKGESVDTSEYIDLCAPDIGPFIRSMETPATPLPPGLTWQNVIADLSTRGNDCSKGGVVQQETSLRSTLIFEGLNRPGESGDLLV